MWIVFWKRFFDEYYDKDKFFRIVKSTATSILKHEQPDEKHENNVSRMFITQRQSVINADVRKLHTSMTPIQNYAKKKMENEFSAGWI